MHTMRPGAEFVTMNHRAVAPTAAPAHGLINGTAAPHSPWQSPVPYLFRGLAAMLGLIAFALLILACSYWKLSGYLDGDRDSHVAVDADREKGSASGAFKPALDFHEHVVVIMAGDERPTFLAKPATSRPTEAELGAAAAPAGASASDGQEKKVDEQCCEVRSQHRSDGVDTASQSRDYQDAASQSRDQDLHDHESSRTTATQLVSYFI